MESKFRVGKYTVDMRFENRTLSMEWEPHTPPAGSLNKKEMKQYRDGRNFMIEEISRQSGLKVACVEL